MAVARMWTLRFESKRKITEWEENTILCIMLFFCRCSPGGSMIRANFKVQLVWRPISFYQRISIKPQIKSTPYFCRRSIVANMIFLQLIRNLFLSFFWMWANIVQWLCPQIQFETNENFHKLVKIVGGSSNEQSQKWLEPELKSENKKNWFNSLHHERPNGKDLSPRWSKGVGHQRDDDDKKKKWCISFVVHRIKINSTTLIKNCGSFASFKWRKMHDGCSCFRFILN